MTKKVEGIRVGDARDLAEPLNSMPRSASASSIARRCFRSRQSSSSASEERYSAFTLSRA